MKKETIIIKNDTTYKNPTIFFVDKEKKPLGTFPVINIDKLNKMVYNNKRSLHE